jgi:hypothetical protein
MISIIFDFNYLIGSFLLNNCKYFKNYINVFVLCSVLVYIRTSLKALLNYGSIESTFRKISGRQLYYC